MKDEKKSKAQLIHELEEARRVISELEDAVSRGEDALEESEQVFRTIFENAADGILLADVENAKLFMGNKRICTELGYSQDEIGNLKVVDLHLEKDLPYVLGQFDQLKRNTIVVARDIPMKRRDASIYYADVSSFPVVLKDRTYLIGIFRDITERRKAEEALRESERRYRSIFENAPFGIFHSTREGKLVDVNPAFSRILCYESPEELISQVNRSSIAEQLYVETDRRSGFVDEVLSKGGWHKFENRYRCKDGRIIFANLLFRSIPYPDPSGAELEGFIEDITERKQAEHQAKKLEDQLRKAQKMESIGTFAGGIAHDFNNILSAIIGYAELAMMEPSDPLEVQNHLQGIIEAGNRARDLVSQIITFSRHGEPKFVPIMLSNVVDDSFKFLRAIIPSFIEIRRNRLETGLVMADPVQLRQVIVNLCSNAVQAMGETGGVLSVGLEKVDADDSLTSRYPDLAPGPYVRLAISDTGHGMAPEVKERIFDPYFTTRKPGEGSGLGLAVVQGIVKKHKGFIACTSAQGEGTTFAIYLPEVESAGKGVEPPETVQPAVEVPHPKGNERILFIDDDPTLVFLASELLGSLGYQVVTQTSSVEALDLFRKDPYRFDLVITDMTMPAMMGDRLAQTFLEIRHDIPIILCTGYSEYISEEQSKSMGIREFIMKPYGTKDMAKTIRRVLDEG